MRRLLVPAVLLLAGCSGAVQEPATEVTVGATTAPVVTATTASTTEPTTKPTTESAAECEPRPADTPLAQTLMDTPTLGEVVMVQELQNLDDPNRLDVFVYLCADPLTEEEHRTAATDLAVAVKDEPIQHMTVGQWTPDGVQGPVLEVDDFGMFTWDRDAARAPETVWG